MTLSMLSLVATVVVLAVHHHDPSTPVPGWLKSFLRMHPKVTRVGVKNPEQPMEERSISLLQVTDLDMDYIKEKKMLSDTDQVQTGLLYSILMELKQLNKPDAVGGNEWKTAAKKLDTIFLCTFLIVTILLNIILLGLYVQNT